MNPATERLTDALEGLPALTTLRDSPGWALIRRKHAEELVALTVRQFDLKTSPQEAENLRQARGRIDQTFSPDKLLENLMAKFRAEAERGIAARGNQPQ